MDYKKESTEIEDVVLACGCEGADAWLRAHDARVIREEK
jgi:hypothetical protein